MAVLKKYWFLIGLSFLFLLNVIDPSHVTANVGTWIKSHHGAEITIITIFIISGMIIDADQVKAGIKDIRGTAAALMLIFVIAPLLAWLFGLMIDDIQILVGLYLVGVMPTTLSSGVVMTGAAGGNIAHALFLTLIANMMSAASIPVTLGALLGPHAGDSAVIIDKSAMALQLFNLIILPLAAGLLINRWTRGGIRRFSSKMQILNQILILVIVWMALSQSKNAILLEYKKTGMIVFIVFLYHGCLLAAAWGFAAGCKIGKGRRESLLFMGGQKTLTLSIILQVKLFPEYGLTLAVCVLHHIVHLFMDGYLAARIGHAQTQK